MLAEEGQQLWKCALRVWQTVAVDVWLTFRPPSSRNMFYTHFMWSRYGERFTSGIVGQSSISLKGSFWGSEKKACYGVCSSNKMGAWHLQGLPPRKRPAPGSLRSLGLEVERAECPLSLMSALGRTQELSSIRQEEQDPSEVPRVL